MVENQNVSSRVVGVTELVHDLHSLVNGVPNEDGACEDHLGCLVARSPSSVRIDK